MKRRFSVFIFCFLLSLLCIACRNTDLEEKNKVTDTTVTKADERTHENDLLYQKSNTEPNTEKSEHKYHFILPKVLL